MTATIAIDGRAVAGDRRGDPGHGIDTLCAWRDPVQIFEIVGVNIAHSLADGTHQRHKKLTFVRLLGTAL